MLGIMTMQDVHLRGLDLNLLVVLDALLGERSVTRAARRLGLSQPATSHALARLRAALGDELLVRGPRGAMVPTARAEAIGEPLRRALADIHRAVAREPPFVPATAKRAFRIAIGDYGEFVLLPPLRARLAREAPGIDLWVVPSADATESLARGEVDLTLRPRGLGSPSPGLYQRHLFDEHFVCAVRADHPTVRRQLTLAKFVALPHVFIAPGGTPGGFVDDALAARGLSRRVAVAVPHFLVAPHLVAQSDLVLTAPARLLRAYEGLLRLRLMPPPIELTGFAMYQVWHERTHADPAHRWLRQVMDEVAKEAPEKARPARGYRS